MLVNALLKWRKRGPMEYYVLLYVGIYLLWPAHQGAIPGPGHPDPGLLRYDSVPRSDGLRRAARETRRGIEHVRRGGGRVPEPRRTRWCC